MKPGLLDSSCCLFPSLYCTCTVFFRNAAPWLSVLELEQNNWINLDFTSFCLCLSSLLSSYCSCNYWEYYSYCLVKHVSVMNLLECDSSINGFLGHFSNESAQFTVDITDKIDLEI